MEIEKEAEAVAEGPAMEEESPFYSPETRTQVLESSDALRSGDPSTSAVEVSRDPLDQLVATTHASSGFSATHVPAPTIPPLGFVDLREVYVLPLKVLFEKLKFTVDADLSEFRRKIALNRIKGFKTEILDAFGDMDNPEELKEFLEFCRDESKSVQSKGVDISGFADILILFEEFQKVWSIAESNIQPRPPFAQITAVENSIKELRGRLVHCRDEVSVDEDQFQTLRAEERSLQSELALQEAQLSELELAIRANREKLVSLRNNQDTVSRRLASNREEIAKGEQELVDLSSEANTLRSTTVEASDVVKQGYESALTAMRLIHTDFSSCIEQL